MANTIKLKRGSGSDPTASDLTQGEIAVRTDNGKLFTKKDDNSVVEISGSGGGGAVDSVNSQTGSVVLDADDISDASTTNKFTTSSDISKLAGIESNATADQTATEIKTAYESNSDTNAFTDAEKTKLSGIAANATVYNDAAVDTHLNTSTASSGEVLSYNGTDYAWVSNSGGGGGSSSLSTAVYEGPASDQAITSTSYATVNVATAVGTPASVFTNSSGEITLGAAGTYLATCTIVVSGSTNNYRWTGELNIEQDTGSGFTELQSVRGGYIRVNNCSQDSYISITRIVTTSDSNDEIRFRFKRRSLTAGNGNIIAGNSSIQIIRLDGIPGAQGPAGAAGADGADGPSNIPQNSQSSAYTLVASDNGKHIKTNANVTVPSGVFSEGDVVTVFNNAGTNISIIPGTGVLLGLAASSSNGTRTLASAGLCTLLCLDSDTTLQTFVISGAGLT